MDEIKIQNDDIKDICDEVLSVINAVRFPDVETLLNRDKEVIYSQLDKRIAADLVARKKRSFFLKTLPAACLCVLIACGIAFFAYTIGKQTVKEEPQQEINLMEVTSQKGTVSKFALPDSTIVTLNGESRLSYPMKFGGKRDVSLTGEAIFEVASDPLHPFIVSTKEFVIQAVGTRFVVRAYDEDMRAFVTLEEGSVNAMLKGSSAKDNILLQPSQQLELNRETGALTRRTVDTQLYSSWAEGILDFKDMTLNEIAKVLERRFNIRIVISSEALGKVSYGAQFKYGETPEQILKTLSYRRNWKFSKQDNYYEIVQFKH